MLHPPNLLVPEPVFSFPNSWRVCPEMCRLTLEKERFIERENDAHHQHDSATTDGGRVATFRRHHLVHIGGINEPQSKLTKGGFDSQTSLSHRWNADIAGRIQRCNVRSDILVGDVVPQWTQTIAACFHLERDGSVLSPTASMKMCWSSPKGV
jgi:hypothetical protein